MCYKQNSLMKVAVILLLTLLAITTTGSCAEDFVITKITPAFLPTPMTTGDKQRRGNGDDQWLAVEVDYRANAELTDEITFNYFIAMGGKILSGEVTYVNIEKSRELHSVMYINPRALKREAKAKRVSLNAIENIAVQIMNKGAVVAQRSIREGRGEWWKAEAVKGEVLKKNQTPFCWSDYDYYEEMKPEVH